MRCTRRLAACLSALALSGLTSCGERPAEPEGAIPPPAEPPIATASTTTAATKQAASAARRPARSSLAPARSGRLFSTADRRSFRALQSRLGPVGLVAGPVGRSGGAERLGSLRSGSAWSTIKLPIALRILQDGARGEDEDLIRRALTASDNAAAAALWSTLSARYGGPPGAAQAVEEVLAQGGDRATRVSTQGRGSFSPYGQTEWGLSGAQKFVAGLAGGCTRDADAAARVLGLMGEVIPEQSWGLGSVVRPARFKGGWGPGIEGTYLVRQLGVIASSAGRREVAVAIAASPGSFEAGSAALTSLAQWTARHMDTRAARSRRC